MFFSDLYGHKEIKVTCYVDINEMKNTTSMINQARLLEHKGLFRRAMSVWQDIAVQTAVTECLRDLAWQRLMAISSYLDKQAQANRETLKDYPERRKNVESDRLQVVIYLKDGLTPKEIAFRVARSSAFIYDCKKYID